MNEVVKSFKQCMDNFVDINASYTSPIDEILSIGNIDGLLFTLSYNRSDAFFLITVKNKDRKSEHRFYEMEKVFIKEFIKNIYLEHVIFNLENK